MNPIETLMNEHQRILAVLESLSSWARGLSGRADDARAELAEFVAFIRGFADALHHGKEEDILFAAMVERGFPRHQGPIAVMLAEHAEFRGLTEIMLALSESATPWGEDDRKKASRTALAYADLLSSHIEKEDQILYPMAEERLSPADMAELARRFELFEANPEHSSQREQLSLLADRLIRR